MKNGDVYEQSLRAIAIKFQPKLDLIAKGETNGKSDRNIGETRNRKKSIK